MSTDKNSENNTPNNIKNNAKNERFDFIDEDTKRISDAYDHAVKAVVGFYSGLCKVYVGQIPKLNL